LVTTSASKKSTWPKQTAIVVSDSPNVHMLLRELLRSYGWGVVDSTPSVDRAIAYVRQGGAYLVIADDTLAMPATRVLRMLLSDPVTVCTPTLTFLLEAHKGETSALARIGRPAIIDKPLTPSKFLPGFVELIRTWEREPYLTLRGANQALLSGDVGRGFRLLAQMTEQEAVQQTAAQALALHLRRKGKIKEAEALLLGMLKRAPRDLGTIFALADLYLHAAMPKLAHRLLVGAKSAFGNSLAVVPDLVQAALMMGDLEDAIRSLYLLLGASEAEDETMNFLARLLFAEGREQEAERVLLNNRAAFKRVQSGWQMLENQATLAAS
jgi:hypothetical protein